MDTFSFIISVIMVMLAIQHEQYWLVFGILGIMLLTAKKMETLMLFIAAIIVFFAAKSNSLNAYWPFILFGIIIMALILGLKPEEQPAGGGDMAGLEALLGGMGGGGGGGAGPLH